MSRKLKSEVLILPRQEADTVITSFIFQKLYDNIQIVECYEDELTKTYVITAIDAPSLRAAINSLNTLLNQIESDNVPYGV